MFSIIAAVGKNNEIGKNNKLLFHIKDDMKFFRETTLEHTVVMGYNTWLSLPGKLKKRQNFVVSYEDVPEADQTITDVDGFIAEHQNTDEEIFIIGGGMIYTKFLPYAKYLYLTEVDSSADADTFFPEFDKSNYSQALIKKGKENGLNYSIKKYTQN